MSKINGSPITQKINEINNENSIGEKKSDWFAFGINVLQNFIITLLIGVIGANFIFLTSSDSIFLDKILPTEQSQYFKLLTGGRRGKYKGGSGEGGDLYDDKGGCDSFSIGNLKSFGMDTDFSSWPYKYRTIIGKDVGFVQDFLNWNIDTIYGAFSINRGLFKKWLSFFSKDNKNFLSNDAFQMLLIAPLTLIFAPFVFIIGFCLSIYSSFKTNAELGSMWAIIGLIFPPWTWFILAPNISLIQFIQYLLLLIFIPLISNINKVKTILKCNIKLLGILFGALVCGSAFSSLDNVTAIVMFVVYILMTIKSFW